MKTAHLIKRPRMTEAKRAANRRNARKSTGPRSARGKSRSRWNALKHGVFARSLAESMRGLGEDPAEFERLKRDFIASFQPATPFEAALVSDLASLWWRKARAERAEAGMQVKDAERGYIERGRELSDLGRLDLEAPAEEVIEVGLMRLPDSPAKFEEAAKFLKMLLARVERGQEPAGAEVAMRVLYGVKPTCRGQLILGLARDLREAEARQAAATPPEPDAAADATGQPDAFAESGDTASPGATEDSARYDDAAAPQPPENLDDEADLAEENDDFSPQLLRALLANELTAEILEVERQQVLFLERHVEYSGAVFESHLAPRDPRWPTLLRYENDLEGRIDRKLKQLEKLQSETGWGGRLRRLNGYVPPRAGKGRFAGSPAPPMPHRGFPPSPAVHTPPETLTLQPHPRVPRPQPRVTNHQTRTPGNAKTKLRCASKQTAGWRKGSQNEPRTNPERSAEKAGRSHARGRKPEKGKPKFETRNSSSHREEPMFENRQSKIDNEVSKIQNRKRQIAV